MFKTYPVIDNRKSLHEIDREEDLNLIESFGVINSTNQQEAVNLFRKNHDIQKVVDFCKHCVKKEYAQKLKEKANLSKRFQKSTFDNFNAYTNELKIAYNKAKKYFDLIFEMVEEGTNIVFEGHGCVGVGKTHLAYSIANAALDSGIPTIAINTMSLIDTVSYLNTNKKLKDELFNIDLLVIDDLGKEYTHEWVLSEMYRILNYRYENCKPTVITTEDSISTLRQTYKIKSVDGTIKDCGKSLFSRICEDVVIVSVTGDDYRIKKHSLTH